ncbi:MAG: tyrosine-type recombinase/integrase [Planctomycetota bacterium]
MPVPLSKKIPQLRLHRPTGQAVVRLVNPRGGRRDYYLGAHGSDESRERFNTLVAAWIQGAHELPDRKGPVVGGSPRTLSDLADRFHAWATKHYRRPDGTSTGEVLHLRRATDLLLERFGSLHPEEFSPNKLRAFRDGLIERPCRETADDDGQVVARSTKTLSRRYINSVAQRIKRMFRWAESRELVPASTYHRLATMESLAAGRSGARETKGLRAVTEQEVNSTVQHLSPQVAALVWLCWYTGARMGEAVQLATRHVDMSTPDLWMFRPPQHKNLHRQKTREIPIGPKAQAVLKPFICLERDRAWFRPCDALAETHRRRRTSLDQAPPPARDERNRRKRKVEPLWKAGVTYSTNAVQIAIRRACSAAGIEPAWTPHMLRHAALTRIREECGLEVAAAVGGHWSLDVTEMYTSATKQRMAADAMKNLG